MVSSFLLRDSAVQDFLKLGAFLSRYSPTDNEMDLVKPDVKVLSFPQNQIN